MKKHIFLNAAMALSSLFTPLKAQQKETVLGGDYSNISTSTNSLNTTLSNADIHKDLENILDKVMKEKQRTDSIKSQPTIVSQNIASVDPVSLSKDDDLSEILSGNRQKNSLPHQQDLDDLLADLEEEEKAEAAAAEQLKRKVASIESSKDSSASETKKISSLTKKTEEIPAPQDIVTNISVTSPSSSKDNDLNGILSKNEQKSSLPHQQDLDDLLADLEKEEKAEAAAAEQLKKKVASAETKEDHSSVKKYQESTTAPIDDKSVSVVVANTSPKTSSQKDSKKSLIKEETKSQSNAPSDLGDLLEEIEIKGGKSQVIVQQDLVDLLNDLEKDSPSQSRKEIAVSENPKQNVQEIPVAEDVSNQTATVVASNTESIPLPEKQKIEKENNSEKEDSSIPNLEPTDFVKTTLANNSNQEVSVPTNSPENNPNSSSNSNNHTSEKIAFGIWAGLLGLAAAIQGKKYICKKTKNNELPEGLSIPFIQQISTSEKKEGMPQKEREEKILDDSGPAYALSPFSPIDLQNYLTETLSPSMIQSVLKKKQEGIKLLPYYPVELDISPAKDPLLEKDRKILAQRLMALKSIGEIQKERYVLRLLMAKARRQDNQKAIDIITARREVLSEKIKKARLIVIGKQLESIRDQRRQLTKRITLAKRKHDHWQIDSVQKQRATLKKKEKTVKGFIRNFSYDDYRHQWHTQRKQSPSRA